jgi:O-antigen/teichoic acid export membrane protein
MGTGLNGQIIGTSAYWRVDFFTGIFLIVITLPLNYLMTRSLGVVGPAISNLISLSLYNLIRFFFLWKKFHLQPFDLKSAIPIPLALTGFILCHYLFGGLQGLQWMILRSSLFIGIYLSGVLFFNISPDIKPVWQTLLKKMGLSSGKRDSA